MRWPAISPTQCGGYNTLRTWAASKLCVGLESPRRPAVRAGRRGGGVSGSVAQWSPRRFVPRATVPGVSS